MQFPPKFSPKKWIWIGLLLLVIGCLSGFAWFWRQSPPDSPRIAAAVVPLSAVSAPVVEPPSVAHIATPDPVRGIYITSWVASGKEWRNRLVDKSLKARFNTVVIDVKDSTGYVSFDTEDATIKALGTEQIRIRDLREWIRELHQEGIYVIARIVVFQDPLYTQKFPDQSIQTREGGIWRDRNGLAFVDPSSKAFWDYIVRISKISAEIGFDELNYDYIRFPTDGNLANMVFPLTSTERSADAKWTIKAHALEKFFAYLSTSVKPLGVPISADIFGMAITENSDLGIGQQLEIVVPYFDYICPMIYPSHWPKGYRNFPNPADNPYEIVRHSVSVGLERIPLSKMRPWLQDFNMGATYTPDKMMAQKQGQYELGVRSFLVWDASNRYRTAVYEPSQ